MKAEGINSGLTDVSTVRVPARVPAWVVPGVKTALLIVDLALAFAAFAGAFYIREGEPLMQRTGGATSVWTAAFAPYGALLILVVPIRVITLAYYDLYRLRGEFSFVEDAIRVFKATAIGSLLIVAGAFLYRGGFHSPFRAFSYARGVFVIDFLLALAGFMSVRFMMRAAQMFARRHDLNLIPTLVVGRGEEAATFINEIRQRPELGYRVIGVLENDGGAVHPALFEGVPVVGDLARLPDAILESGANEVIIADPTVPGEALFDVMMRVGRRRGVEFRIAPSLFNFLPRKTEVDQIGALPMITLFRSPLSSTARVIKRTSDLIIALVASLLLLPFWLLFALLIKLDSKGPVFYKQERVGMDGRVFLFHKFRTMHPDADDATHREFQRRYIAGQPEVRLASDGRPVYKLQTDPRITRVGRWLRRLSLDELPQLLNVLRGDMSVVGPRPPIPYEVESYALWHRKRLDMKPGMTGLWQVSGRNRLPFDEMVRLDLFYIENWSLLLDLKIILRTLPVMLRGDAY
jgi:exopolysaccharide biosynthesis polyprenyl glycosylphosphotransferase